MEEGPWGCELVFENGAGKVEGVMEVRMGLYMAGV